MTEPEWYRQRGLACEFCGGPGRYIALPPPAVTYTTAESDLSLSDLTIKTAVACPEHRFFVLSRHERLDDEFRFAEYKHGRPVLDAETHPEQMKRSIATILRRLKGWDGPEDSGPLG